MAPTGRSVRGWQDAMLSARSANQYYRDKAATP